MRHAPVAERLRIVQGISAAQKRIVADCNTSARGAIRRSVMILSGFYIGAGQVTNDSRRSLNRSGRHNQCGEYNRMSGLLKVALPI